MHILIGGYKRIWHATPQVYRYMLGGFLLTLNAGFINVVALASSFHQPVTHLTGITSNLGMALVAQQPALAPLVATLVAYVAGSMISGLVIESTQLRFGRRYGFILMIEGGVLAAAVPLLASGRWVGLYLLALASGMQNGMVTTYSGAIVRTSHITGLLTDFGIYLGKWVMGRPREGWRGQMYVVLFLGFLLGGIIGTLAFEQLGLPALYLCAALTGVLGFGYWLWRHRVGRKPGKLSVA